MEDDKIKRFDMVKKPVRQKWFLMPIIWGLSFPEVFSHKTKIERVNTEGLKPPYILLCNHNAFIDFKVTTAAIFPRRANYVVAIDGFIGREWLLRNAGCICKRKFTSDLILIRQLKRVLDNGDIAVIYPEARYSLCGTTAVLPDSLGRMVKMFKVPVVSLIMHGHHIDSPFWNLKKRGVKNTEAVFTQLYTKEELESVTPEEINARIREAFVYDEYRWQKEKGIKVTYKDRAKGLHKVLYQCPNCQTEYKMHSSGDTIACSACGKEWTLSEYGELAAKEGSTEFSHIPDWYEWERANVRRLVEAGDYFFESPVRVKSLPNAKKFIDIGEGVLRHDMNGFELHCENAEGEQFEMIKTVPSLYSCHIEYEYLGKFGDCIDLNTLTDTYYIYPTSEEFSVTKIALATEELYNHYMSNLKKTKSKEEQSI